jgi:alpha-glucosidase
MKRVLILLHIILCTCIVTQAKNYTVSSPDGKTKVTVTAGKQLSWSINYNGERILNPSLMQMDIEGQTEQPGVNPKVIKAKTLKVNSEQTAVIPLKQRIIKDQYNQLTLTCKGNYAIVFRVYNNGAAYRFETSLKQPKVIINTETIEQNWTEGCKLYWPREKNQEYLTHCEAIFDELNISSLTNDMKGYLPIYLSTPKGTKVVIMESDLFDYPNLFLTGDRNNTLSGEFPPVVLKSALKEGADRDEVLLEKASYIAETEGTRTFPWRVLMINEDDKAVIENNLVYQLASPSVTQDTDWIKPGKISWDWWSTLNVYGVDFKAGVNTDTYKYFIDFASKYGIEYILLDEGWSAGTWNIKEPIPGLDIPELVRYGKERNVGLVLWTLWNPLDKELDEILDVYEKWGIKGIKVDFMQRSDQYMVNFYERVGKAAMERKLLVDFHGSFKPSGLQKKYPNVMTFEGVLGLEHDKDSRDINPVHDLILPFTRMVAGPMDYTPGAVNNATAEDFYINFVHPISLGTRAHQAALYVVYESPLQMLADSPSNYYKAPEFASFISRIPTIWEDTKAITAKIGEQLVIARKNGKNWYLAGLTDWNANSYHLGRY